jgi:hypothetical protein
LNLRPLGYERIKARDLSGLSTTRANSDNDFWAGESAGVGWVRPPFADRTRTAGHEIDEARTLFAAPDRPSDSDPRG